MERLTKRNEVGYGVVGDVTIENGIRRTILTPHEASKIQEALNRLAAYEETDREPEEIKDLISEKSIFNLVGRVFSLAPDRVRELVYAEKDGWLAVLPDEGYTWKIRGDIALAIVAANCRGAQDEGCETCKKDGCKVCRNRGKYIYCQEMDQSGECPYFERMRFCPECGAVIRREEKEK